MLISCFQCRQQLDVPEDSAGRRVRCPHCQYVIVVPAKAKADEVAAPAVALPSMDLDDGEKPQAAKTKVSPQPLPPVYDTPRVEPSKPEKKSEPIEDLPPMPSIERGKGRRRPMSPLPAQTNWRKVVGIGIVVGVVVIGVVAFAAVSSRQNRIIRPPQPPQVMFQPQQMRPNPGPNMQFFGKAPPMQGEAWRVIENVDHRFKASFPDQPVQMDRVVDLEKHRERVTLTTFFVQQFDWQFSVAHRKLTAREYEAIAPDERLRRLHAVMENFTGSRLALAAAQPVPGTQDGREWSLRGADNRMIYLRTYLAREGENFHHYLVMVNAPMVIQRADVKVNRFLSDFALLIEDGSRLYEEYDALNGTRRDNEFTALALHPKEPIAVTGTMTSNLRIARIDKPAGGREGDMIEEQPAALGMQFPIQDGKPIDQLTISADGRWLAVACAGQIQYWRDWTALVPKNQTTLPGLRCAFTKKPTLLVATADSIKECTLEPHGQVATLPIPDFPIKGFALSSDDNTLAVFGDKSVELWQRREKKKLGRIEAHDGAITAVAFSPDGKTLASASLDRTIKLWQVDTQAPRAALNQHAWGVWSLAFTPDGKYLASGGLDGMALVWDLTAPKPTLAWAQAHQFPVRAVAFDADQNLYLTCKHFAANPPGGGKQMARQVRKLAWSDIKLDPAVAVRNLAQQAGMHLPTCSPISFQSPDGQTYVSATDTMDDQQNVNNSLRVWDTTTATLKYARNMKFQGMLSPDGKWFALARPGQQLQMQLLEIQTGRLTDSIPLPDSFVSVVTFTPDSKSLWVRRPNELVRYDLQVKPGGAPLLTQQKVVELKKPNDQRGVFVHVSTDRKTFLIESSSLAGLSQRKLCSTTDGTPLMPQAADAPSEPNQYLRLRPFGNRVEIEDFLNGTSHVIGQQRMPMIFHAIDVQRKHAASTQVGTDQTVRVNLWDLQARRPVLTLPDLRAKATGAVRFSPDGQQLVLVTDAYTRIVPINWLLERKGFLQSNEVAAP